nr:DUF5134 domain-containing protein [Auraticoccus cholistanensis]
MRPSRWPERLDHGLHLLMSLAMLTMAWTHGSSVPVWPQLVLFALSSLWFLGRALWSPGQPLWSPGRTGHAATSATEDASVAWLPWFHVVMTLAMVWMLAVEPPEGGSAHDHTAARLGLVPELTGLGLVALLLAGTALSVSAAVHARASRAPHHRPGGFDVSHTVMGVGMLAMTAPALLG